MKITYQPKWKEELIGSIGENEFTIEMTMGQLYVFFPTESKWESNSPSWAKGKWNASKEAAQAWCREKKIEFTIDEQAWVDFSKK